MKKTALYICLALLLVLASSCDNNQPEEPIVGPGKKVTFDYAAGFDNGSLFDTTFENAAKAAEIYDPNRIYQPAAIIYGRDQLFPGLEDALLGMKEGEIKNIRIPPHKAFGNKIEASAASMPKKEISNFESLKISDVVTIVNSEGKRINAYVKEIGKENVTLDLNHPLAGHYVRFSIIVVGIE